MKTVAIIQARMGSTRLPGKVVRDIGDCPAIYWVASAVAGTSGVNDIWLATSTAATDDVLFDWVHDGSIPAVLKMSCYRGSENDVLDRFYQCATRAKADLIVRVTGDCPLIDNHVLDEVVSLQKQTGLPYVSNVDPATYPDGLDVQVMTMEALQLSWEEASRTSDRETVCEYVNRNRERFPSANLTCPIPGLANERWVLDTEEDLEFLRQIVKIRGDLLDVRYTEILDILRQNPKLRDINKKWTRNERFFESIVGEKV